MATVSPEFDGLFVTVGSKSRNIHELTRAALIAQGLSDDEAEELEFDDEDEWLKAFDRVMEQALRELGATHVHDTETGEKLSVDEYMSSSHRDVEHMDVEDEDDWQPASIDPEEERQYAEEWYENVMADISMLSGPAKRRAASLAATLRDEMAKGQWHGSKATALKDEFWSLVEPAD